MKAPGDQDRYPVTPDGHYFVVKGRLWRRTNPALAVAEREQLVADLMDARRSVAVAMRKADPQALGAARRAVDQAKRGLGERGPVWWTDGSPDLNRRLAKNTIYGEWLSKLAAS